MIENDRQTKTGVKPGRHRRLGMVIAWSLISAMAAYALFDLCYFMFDVEKKAHAVPAMIRDMDPPDEPMVGPPLTAPFFLDHSCLSGYVVAAYLASSGVDNVYLSSRYRTPEEETPIHVEIGDAFRVDTYQYPPPFLLLPELLMMIGGDFWGVRSLFFVLTVLVFVVTAVALVLWLGGRATVHAAWLLPSLLLVTPVALTTLQIGNVHFLIISLSVLGMLLLERGRIVLGGAALGFAIVAKLFPAVLLLYLGARRRWSLVLAVVVAMALWCLLTFLIFGGEPFEAFVGYQIPRLATGEAQSLSTIGTYNYIRGIVENASIMGTVYKLHSLGLLYGLAPDGVASVAVWLYTILLLGAVVMAGHRQRKVHPSEPAGASAAPDRLDLVLVWLTLLILAQLRTPFLPWVYGNIAVLWLLILLIPRMSRRIGTTLVLTGLGVVSAFCVPFPIGTRTVSFDLYTTLIAQLAVVALCPAIVLGSMRRFWRDQGPGEGTHEA